MIYLLALFACLTLADEHATLPKDYKDAQDIMAKKNIDGKRKYTKTPPKKFVDATARRDDVQVRGKRNPVISIESGIAPQTTEAKGVGPSETGQDRPASTPTDEHTESNLTSVKLDWASQSMMDDLYKDWLKTGDSSGEAFKFLSDDGKLWVAQQFTKEKGGKK